MCCGMGTMGMEGRCMGKVRGCPMEETTMGCIPRGSIMAAEWGGRKPGIMIGSPETDAGTETGMAWMCGWVLVTLGCRSSSGSSGAGRLGGAVGLGLLYWYLDMRARSSSRETSSSGWMMRELAEMAVMRERLSSRSSEGREAEEPLLLYVVGGLTVVAPDWIAEGKRGLLTGCCWTIGGPPMGPIGGRFIPMGPPMGPPMKPIGPMGPIGPIGPIMGIM